MTFWNPPALVERLGTVLLLAVFALLAGTEVFLVLRGDLAWERSIPLLVLVVLGAAGLYLGRTQRVTKILCLLLASMAVIFSYELPWGGVIESWPLLALVWESLFWLFGFVFVHFASIFPVEARAGMGRMLRTLAIYAPYAVLFVCRRLPGIREVAGSVFHLTILVGVFLGLAIFIRKYRSSLTLAEKDRLRLVLIGCLTGLLPEILVVLSVGEMPALLLRLAGFLFPLFPLSLIAAVAKENFSEIGRRSRAVLVYGLAAAGIVTTFFLSSFVMMLAFRSEEYPLTPYLIALALVLVLSLPAIRWSGSFVSAHFHAPVDQRTEAESAPSRFEPIQPNPYFAGNPVRSPEMFFGREAEFQFIRGRLLGEKQGCAIVLCGERRIGKTSILYQILNGRVGAEVAPVFLDMQGMVVRQDSEFLEQLAAKIRAAVPEAGSGSPAGIQSYLDFNAFMDQVARSAGQRRILLLIDEYELIETKVKEGKLSPEIYEYFSSLLLRYSRLSYVFTGSKTLDESAAWSSLLAKSIFRKVSFLQRKDAESLIRTPLKNRVKFTPGIINEILRLTNGHAFYTQVLCQTLVEVLNEFQTNLVTRRALDETVHRVLENPPPQLYYQWKTFVDAEKVVLSALATQLKKPYGYLSPDQVEKLFRSLSGKIPNQPDATAIRMHFENLRESSFLDRDQTRFRFTMDLMRLWVQSEHNIWKVLSEIGTAKPLR